MKKLLLLFFSLLAFGYMSQACDDSKTYIEMLDGEKDAVNAFIKKHDIRAIPENGFETSGYKTSTTKNGHVAFSNGVYMQIVGKGIITNKPENGSIKSNNVVAVRFIEYGIKADGTTYLSVVLPGFENYPNYYTYPDVFRYVNNGTSAAGVFTEGLTYARYDTTDVPPRWLPVLKYVTNYAHVRIVVPSKMGYQNANQYVNPYFYDIRKSQRVLN